MKKLLTKKGGTARRFWLGIVCSTLLIALFGSLAYATPQQTDQQSQETKQAVSSASAQQKLGQNQDVAKRGGTSVEQRIAALDEKLTRIEGKVDQLSKDLNAMWRELWGMIDRLLKK